MSTIDLSEFLDDLKALETKLRNKVVKKAQKDALTPIAAEIKDKVPVDTGELKAGVSKAKVGPRRQGLITSEIEISTPEDNPHVLRTEFGTRDQPAQPVIRPVVDKSIDQIEEVIREALNKAIENKD